MTTVDTLAGADRTISVIIAAHNEEAVLGACLEALLAQPEVARMQIIVSANGCTDDTVGVARRYGVEVLDRPEPGKSAAMNAAERIAVGSARIYLDADIIVPADGIRAVLAPLDADPPPLAVVPRRRVNTSGRTWPVKGYFAINERLPVYRGGLFGRGMITLSQDGRARFGEFPAMIADDLFVDSQFTAAEKAETAEVEVVVDAPHTTRDLLHRLVRVRRGNAQLRAAAAAGRIGTPVRPADRWAWLREVLGAEPHLVFAAVPYVTITVVAALLARRSPESAPSWGRDESTRHGPRIAASAAEAI